MASLQTMQGLTPTFIVKVPDTVDLTEAAHVYVSLRQGRTLVKLTEGFNVEAHKVDIYLTQAQTIIFEPGDIEIQVNWTYSDGSRAATKIKNITITRNHLLEVLP